MSSSLKWIPIEVRNVKYWHAPCQFYYARNGENFPFLHRHAIESRMSKNSGLSHGGFGRWNINRPPIIIKHFASKGTNNWWERRNKPQFWIEQANRKVTNCDIYSGISLGLLECHGLLTLRVQGATKIRGVDVFGDEIVNEYWIFFFLPKCKGFIFGRVKVDRWNFNMREMSGGRGGARRRKNSRNEKRQQEVRVM
jgi:hypothetical protein